MWREDNEGTTFSGPAEAYRELRERAQRTIAEGERQGFDLRDYKVRIRDDQGGVLFDGTLGDAARLEINGRVFLPQRRD